MFNNDKIIELHHRCRGIEDELTNRGQTWLRAAANAEKNFEALVERVASLEYDRAALSARVIEFESELETLAAHVGVAFRTVNGRQLVPTVAIEKNKFKQ